MNLNGVDLFILAVLGLSSLLSLLRGLVREVLSLASWVVAFWLSFAYTATVAGWFTHTIPQAPARIALSFLILMIGTLIAMGLLMRLILMLIDRSGLGSTDKLLGMVFGFLRGLAVVLLLVLLAGLTPLPREPWWRQSTLLPLLMPTARVVIAWMPPEFAAYFGYDSSSRPQG